MCGGKIADVAANVIWEILIRSGQMKVKSRHVRASAKRICFKQRAECGKCRSTLCLTLMLGAQELVVRGDAPGLIAAEQRDRRSTSWLDQPNRLGERHGCIEENPSSLRARASDASGAVGPTEVRLLSL